MKNNIPCEIVRDLFPSYIDELTSDVTNEYIKEHLAECESCKEVLASMTNHPIEEQMINIEEKEEIDFLKKTRKQNNKLLIGSIVTALAIIFVVLIAKTYFIGTNMNSEYVSYVINVDENRLNMSGAPIDSKLAITHVDFTEENGCVKVAFKSAKRSFLSNGYFENSFSAKQNIEEVWIGNKIVWSHGMQISPLTSAVYNSRHPYIGNMPDNGKTAGALNIQGYLGNYTVELQTKEQPYGWKFVLKNSFMRNRESAMTEQMKSYAYALIAVIDNLGEVSFEYVIDNERKLLTITQNEASMFAGQDIKKVGKDICLLESMLAKTNLLNTVYVSNEIGQPDKNSIRIYVVNFADSKISGMGINYSTQNGKEGGQHMIHADYSLIKSGEWNMFELIPEDFDGDVWDGEQSIFIKLHVTDENGNEYEVKEPLELMAGFGNTYRLNLSGDAVNGFELKQ